MSCSVLEKYGNLLQSELEALYQIRFAAQEERLLIFEGKNLVTSCAWSKEDPLSLELTIVSPCGPNISVVGALAKKSLTVISQQFREALQRERSSTDQLSNSR